MGQGDNLHKSTLHKSAEAAAREAFGCDADVEPREGALRAAGSSFLIHFAQGAGWTFGAAAAVFAVVQLIKCVVLR
jgi:hypothetical protein